MGVSLPGDNVPLPTGPIAAPQNLPGTVPITNTSMYNEETGQWDKRPGTIAPSVPPSPVAAAAAAAPVTPAASGPLKLNADGSYANFDTAPATPQTAVPMSPEEFEKAPGPLRGGSSGMEPKGTPGKIHGYKADVDAGVAEAGTGLLGLPMDISAGIRNKVVHGINWAFGTNFADVAPIGGAHSWNKLFSYVPGFTNPEDVEDLDAAHAAVRGATRTVASTVGPGLIAKAAEPIAAAVTPARVLSTGEMVPAAKNVGGSAVETLATGATPKVIGAAAVGGAGGGAVRSWVPPEWADPAEALVNLGLTATTLGATSVVQSGGRGVGSAVRTVLPGKGEPVIDPATGQPFYKAGTVNPQTGVGEPIVVTPGAQRMAVGRVAGAMGQTPEQAAASIEAAQAAAPEIGAPPPPKPGMVRFYHGGDNPTSGGGRWVTADPQYAAGHGAVSYVDMPADHPLVARNLDPDTGRYTHFEAPPDVAANLKPLGTGPRYQGTAGQITGDTGLLSLERQLQSQPRGRVVLADQLAENQRAFAAAVQGNAPTEQVQQAAGNYFRDLQATERARIEAEAAGHSTRAQAALEGTGAHQDFAGDATQGMGATSRETLEGIRQPIKDRFGAAYDALEKGDPNLALDTSPIWETRQQVIDELGKAGELTPSETKVFEAARDFRGVNKFTDLRSFQKAVSEKLREVGRNPQYGTESPAYRRLSILMDAVDRSMTEAADRFVASDPANASHILNEIGEGGPGGERASGGTVSGGATVSGTVPGAQAGGATGVRGAAATGGEQAGVPGGTGGNRPVAPVSANGGAGSAETAGLTRYGDAGRKPADINRRIAELGGVKSNAEMLSYDLDKVNYGNLGNPVRKSGLEPDKMREILAQPHEGYLRPGETIDGMVQKMHQSRTPGQEVYPEHYQAQVRAQEAIDQEARRTADARGAASDEIEGARLDRGLRLSNAEHQHAVDLRMQGLHEDEAIDQAMAHSDAQTLDRAAQRETMGPPGVGPEATQSEMHMAGASKLVENIKPEDVQTIRELNAGYREYKNNWRTGAIGKVLQRISGGFKIGDSEVPGQLFPKGPKGAEAADQLIKNAGSVEAAQRIIGDYPAKVFRDMALRDGIVTEAGFNQFQKAYGPVLAKFPELQARFANARAAQATVERAAADHAARLRAYENSAAKAYLGKVEEGATPLKAIGSIMGSDNPAARLREIMQQASGNQAAIEGIRQNFRDWMATKAGSSVEQEGGRPTTFVNSSFKNMLKNADVRNAAKVVLTPDQYSMLFKVADAMDQVGQSANAIKIPGSPGTAADTHALEQALGNRGFLSNFGRMWLGEEAGHMVGSMLTHGGSFGHGFIGMGLRAVGGGVVYLRNQMRAAGIRNAEDLALEMMANPNFGKVMLRNAPTNPDSPIWRQTARQMLAATAGIASQVQGSR